MTFTCVIVEYLLFFMSLFVRCWPTEAIEYARMTKPRDKDKSAWASWFLLYRAVASDVAACLLYLKNELNHLWRTARADELTWEKIDELDQQLIEIFARGETPDAEFLVKMNVIFYNKLTFSSPMNARAAGIASRFQFTNPDNVLSALNEHLHNCSRAWRLVPRGDDEMEPNIAYPLMPLLNASGLGKSRSMMELAFSNCLFMIVFCLRHDPNLELVPPQTREVFDFFTQPPGNEALFVHKTCRLMHMHLQLLLLWLNELQVRSFQPFTLKHVARLWSSLISDQQEFIEFRQQVVDMLETDILDGFGQELTAEASAAEYRETFEITIRNIDEKLRLLNLPLSKDSGLIAFFVDEAGQFFNIFSQSSFRLFCIALTALPFHRGSDDSCEFRLNAVCVVADTNAKLRTFAPPGMKLHPPYILKETFNIWVEDFYCMESVFKPKNILRDFEGHVFASFDRRQALRSPEKKEKNKSITDMVINCSAPVVEDFTFQASHGRPAHLSFFIARLFDAQIWDEEDEKNARWIATAALLEEVEKKLLNTDDISSCCLHDGISITQAVALMSTLFSVNSKSEQFHAQVIEDLTSFHLRVVDRLKNGQVVTVDRPEPILQLAVRDLVFIRNLVPADAVIKQFFAGVIRSHTKTEFVGELLAQFFTQAGYEAARQIALRPLFGFVSVDKFLNACLGTSLTKKRHLVERVFRESPRNSRRLLLSAQSNLEQAVDLALRTAANQEIAAARGPPRSPKPENEFPFRFIGEKLKYMKWKKSASLDEWDFYDIGVDCQDFTADQIMQAARAKRNIADLNQIEFIFGNALIRVNGFIRLASPLTAEILKEFRVTGTGLQCVAHQEIFDLAIPGVMNGDLFVVYEQVKFWATRVPESEKTAWLRRVEKFYITNITCKFVAIFCEMGETTSSHDCEFEVRPMFKSQTEPEIIGFAVFITRWRASEIDTIKRLDDTLRDILRSFLPGSTA